MKSVFGVCLLAFLVGVAMSSAIGRAMIQTKSGSTNIVQLPPPEQKGKISVEEALTRRRSVREFTREALTERELSQLLWAAQGMTHPDGLRTAPSAGALYPLEIYVATASGFHHYEPSRHRLIQLSDRDLRATVRRAGPGGNHPGSGGVRDCRGLRADISQVRCSADSPLCPHGSGTRRTEPASGSRGTRVARDDDRGLRG